MLVNTDGKWMLLHEPRQKGLKGWGRTLNAECRAEPRFVCQVGTSASVEFAGWIGAETIGEADVARTAADARCQPWITDAVTWQLISGWGVTWRCSGGDRSD